MNKISRILCVIDPTSTAQPALERAAWLAGCNDSGLELFVCYYNEYLSGDRFFDSRSLRKARQDVINEQLARLEELAEPLREKGLTVAVNATWDHPLHEGIVRHAKKSGAEIVVKDTHRHSLAERVLLSNTDWQLMRLCKAPLWLVKPRQFAEEPLIVAAIDPMNENDKPAALDDEILLISRLIASRSNGEVHAFHAYDPRIAIATATANSYLPVSLPMNEIDKQMREQHGKRFKEVANYHGIDDEHSHLVQGRTHEELPAFAAKHDTDLIVMGAVARNRLKRLFIGATAERTMDHLPCDLLVVKPDWFHTPIDILGEKNQAL